MSTNQALFQEDVFTVTEVREGDFEGNAFANIKVIQDEHEESEGYIGVKIGKFKAESRELAARLITELKAVGVPARVHFKTGVSFGAKEAMHIMVKDFVLAKPLHDPKAL
jgi:hypothetical protein